MGKQIVCSHLVVCSVLIAEQNQRPSLHVLGPHSLKNNYFHFLNGRIGKPHFDSSNLTRFLDSYSLDRPMGDIFIYSLHEKHSANC